MRIWHPLQKFIIFVVLIMKLKSHTYNSYVQCVSKIMHVLNKVNLLETGKYCLNVLFIVTNFNISQLPTKFIVPIIRLIILTNMSSKMTMVSSVESAGMNT